VVAPSTLLSEPVLRSPLRSCCQPPRFLRERRESPPEVNHSLIESPFDFILRLGCSSLASRVHWSDGLGSSSRAQVPRPPRSQVKLRRQPHGEPSRDHPYSSSTILCIPPLLISVRRQRRVSLVTRHPRQVDNSRSRASDCPVASLHHRRSPVRPSIPPPWPCPRTRGFLLRVSILRNT
jgi:hypothetical protein